jgi:hypothetical protein
MALLNYQNLDGVNPDELLGDVFGGLKPFMDYLSRTKKFLESDAAVLRLGWKPVSNHRATPEASEEESGFWIELAEPEDRPNEPDGTFRSFLDESVKSVYEFKPIAKEDPAIKAAKADQFGPDRQIRIFDRDARNYRLLLSRKPEGNNLLLRPNTDQIKKQMRALAGLRDHPAAGHLPLLRLFAQRESVRWPQLGDFGVGVEHWDILTDVSRSGTDEQRRFVEIALGTPDFALLEGPPGSGKTTALCELILQLIRRGKRVLLCASTHVAVDNVLERLVEPGLKVAQDLVLSIRIGDRSNVSEGARPRQLDQVVRTERASIQSFLRQCASPTASQRTLRQALDEDEEYFKELILSTANLVCGTTIGILQHPHLKRQQDFGGYTPQFDVLILDEASKTTFQEFLVPALLAKRWIVVGDYKQLSPYVDEDAMAVNIAACLPESDRRAECLSAFRAKASHFHPDGIIGEDENHWEDEVAWRIARLHELRLSASDTARKLESEIEDLMPAEGKEEVRRAIDSVRRVALPSVLECLLQGFDQVRAERERTTLTDGFSPDERGARHLRLSYQHRMHPEISAFSRDHVYNGEVLRDAAGMAEKRQLFGYAENKPRAIWLRVNGEFTDGNRNPGEAKVLLDEVCRLSEWASHNPRPQGGAWEVAVLTFYRGQERELRRIFRAATGAVDAYRYFEFGPQLKIELCTVDRFQGHEADVVFISFANTRSTNFLESPNRLNVALTRARYYRVIVGNQSGLARSRGEVLRKLAESEKWEARVVAKPSPIPKSKPNPPPRPRFKKVPAINHKVFESVKDWDITELHANKSHKNGGRRKP